MHSDFGTGAVFEDSTIYQMDSALFGLTVPPRSSQETQVGTTFRYHPNHFLPISGYFGERNINGTSSIPSQTLILRHNTYDTIFNVGIEPVVRLGNARFVFNPGIEFTIRRDTQSPVNFNQDLFRQFVYVTSSSLFNWISLRAGAVHESGPYSQQNLNSRDLGASLEFEVGRPWGRNAFITGYAVRDLLFSPLVREYFTTSTWAGYERKFGQKFSITGLGRVIRSWRVQDQNFAIAQILVPGARFEVKPNDRWAVTGAFDLSRGQGFHLYDNFQSGFLISYMKPLRRSFDDGTGGITVDYPLRISVGIQQQSFPNFTGQGSTSSFRPVIRVSLF